MPNMETATLDLLDLAGLVRRGEATAAELTEDAIARIEAVNPVVNAVVTRFDEEARRVAREPTEPGAPLAGAPFLVKDLYCHYAGQVTSGASRLLTGNVVDHDSELMSRYRRAGLVTLGKTNLCELGTLGTTEPALFGPTRNPWDLGRSSGGSSGGAAAAVASGMVPAAHGGDGAGSIRIPASCCGLFGLKPSRGRITLGPDLGDSLGGIVNEHVLSRSVRDSAALLDATHGPMTGDPYHAERPERPYLQEVGRFPGRLRVAVTSHSLLGTRVDPACVAAVHDTARLCEQLGHHVEIAAPPIDAGQYDLLYRRFWAMTATRSVWAITRMTGQDPAALARELEPFNQHLFETGSRVLAADYVTDLVWFHQFGRTLARFLGNFDVWLTPTLGSPPPHLGHFDAGLHGGEVVMDRFMEFLAFTTFANMAGLPAMSVPLWWTDDGLPVGSQFNGRMGAEGTLFRLASQLEAARPWATQRPPVWAGGGPNQSRPQGALA